MSTNLTSTLPAEGFVREKTVLSIIGITKSTLWRWSAEGKFPKPIKLGPAVTVWNVEAVRRWMSEKIASQSANE